MAHSGARRRRLPAPRELGDAIAMSWTGKVAALSRQVIVPE
jgi:hypothetical protein